MKMFFGFCRSLKKWHISNGGDRIDLECLGSRFAVGVEKGWNCAVDKMHISAHGILGLEAELVGV
jgi:hypothetical protein